MKPLKTQHAWQKKLRPVMTWALVSLAVFFFVASLLQLLYVHRNLREGPTPNLDAAYSMLDSVASSDEQIIAAFRVRSMVILEANIIARRYHQANMSLMTRVWIRYLGFVTGMILSIIGAVFILGKLEGPASEIKGGVGGGGEYSLRTASPGILLTFLGVVLMMTTIVTHHPIKVEDWSLFPSESISPVEKEDLGRWQNSEDFLDSTADNNRDKLKSGR
ncbi:MAG: hypothetical protein GY855_12335 [candidate division Zixibacteria bacterium]|nr:hypothetical protein [candidate division Zixibacteria bacterium]